MKRNISYKKLGFAEENMKAETRIFNYNPYIKTHTAASVTASVWVSLMEVMGLEPIVNALFYKGFRAACDTSCDTFYFASPDTLVKCLLIFFV